MLSPGVLLSVPLSPAEGLLLLLERREGVEGRGRRGGEADEVQVGIVVSQDGILTSLYGMKEGEILNMKYR